MLAEPLAVVDVETTGAHPVHDRLTEVAVISVDGGEVSSEWHTLVDPQRPIPPAIQALTGITDRMVAGAPRFAEIAPALAERLAGRVLVAHNARFDYAFLRREFDRAGIDYRARTLCTVRLSRALYPQQPQHNLDALIARHDLRCEARHRALGDARAVWAFLRAALAEHGAQAVSRHAARLLRRAALPPGIDAAELEAVPQAPGVYVLRDEAGRALYVGKSIAMRSRVLAHFGADLRSVREARLARQTRRIEWVRTAGELGALLIEADLVKRLAPVYNRRLRTARELCGFLYDGVRLQLADASMLDAARLARLHGVFRSRRSAREALAALADAHGLCLRTLGFEAPLRRGAPCFRHQLGRCRGVCAGRESPELHAARTAAALARLRTLAWPWPGPVGVVERDAAREATEVHVLHHWCWLGTARSETELAELLAHGKPSFDLDHYRILVRHLARPRVQVVPLACTAN